MHEQIRRWTVVHVSDQMRPRQHFAQNSPGSIARRQLYKPDIRASFEPRVRDMFVEERQEKVLRVKAKSNLARVQALGVSVAGIRANHEKDSHLVRQARR